MFHNITVPKVADPNPESIYSRGLEPTTQPLFDIVCERASEAIMFNRWDYRTEPIIVENGSASNYLRFELSEDYDKTRNGEGTVTHVFLPVADMSSRPSLSEIIVSEPWFIVARRMRPDPAPDDPSLFHQDEEVLMITPPSVSYPERGKIDILRQIGPKILSDDEWSELIEETEQSDEAVGDATEERALMSASASRRGQLALKLAFYQLVPTIL